MDHDRVAPPTGPRFASRGAYVAKGQGKSPFFFRVGAILAILPMFSCGGPDFRPEDSLMVFCGAGLRKPVEKLLARYQEEQKVMVVADYKGSELLLSAIKISRHGDLYIPGDEDYLDRAEKDGLILERRTLCYFVPVILVAKGNPKGVDGLAGLLKPGIRLGLGDPKACAVGRKTKALFEKAGMDWSEVEKKTVFFSVTVNELGLQIQTGSLDAVVVWDAVAAQYKRHGDIIEMALAHNLPVKVEVGCLKYSTRPQAARALAEWLVSPTAREIFKEFDYRTEPPPGWTPKSVPPGPARPLPNKPAGEPPAPSSRKSLGGRTLAATIFGEGGAAGSGRGGASREGGER